MVPSRFGLAVLLLSLAGPLLAREAVPAAATFCRDDTTTLCLDRGRFRVTAAWTAPDGGRGAGRAVPLTADTGYFWFFSPDNVEVVVKVIDGCALNERFWLFAAGLTDVAVVLTVEDTVAGKVREYRNPSRTPFRPLQDTLAFATCEAAPVAPPPAVDWQRDILATDLTFDLERWRGEARITLAPAAGSAASFSVGDLTIEEVTGPAGPLRFRVTDGRLDVGVPPSDGPAEIRVVYRFRTHERFDGYLSSGTTFLWPTFCGNLFPCKPDPEDGLRFSLRIDHPPAGQVVVFPPVIPADAPPYMLAFTVGDYRYEPLGFTTAGTEVGVWFLHGGRRAALDGTSHLVEMFDFYEQTYGPYLFGDAVASVAAPWEGNSFGGMEHHPFWHVGRSSMGEPLVHAHEAAHGWFGNGVRLRCWEDFVLSEGLATYLAARALEDARGASAGAAVWLRYGVELDRAIAAGDTLALPSTCNEIDLLRHPLWSLIPYLKGAFFLREVEENIGRSALDGALRSFYERYAGEAARMENLLDWIRTETGFDPEEPADRWLRSLGRPSPATSAPHPTDGETRSAAGSSDRAAADR